MNGTTVICTTRIGRNTAVSDIEWEYITIPVPKAPGIFDHAFDFWIPELPLGNKSGGVTAVEVGGKWVGQAYKDPGSKAFQNRVRNYFHNAAYEQGKLLDYPFDGWCRAFLYLFYPKPKSWHPTMTIESSKIPDNDNVIKSICDGLNGCRLIRLKKPDPETGKRAKKVVYFGPYDDDKQIKTHVVDKHYSDVPGARVVLWFYRRLPREPLPGKRTIKAKALQAELQSGDGVLSSPHHPDQRTYRQFLARYG